MRLVIFTISMLLTCAVEAQVTMRDVIRQMPDSLVPYLKTNARLDFIDFMDSGMKAEVSNELGGKSQLTQLTDDYASFTLNASSQLQLRLLSVDTPVDSASHILCMVRTFGVDICESTIGFYTLKWLPLPVAQYITLPTYAHRIQLSSQAPELTIERDVSMDRPANEEQKELEKTLIILKWDGGMFKIH